MALQIFAYWNALSTRHVLPTRLYCGVSQIGLFGSFQAVHFETFGSGWLIVALFGARRHSGGGEKPEYRDAAAYAKSCSGLKSFGATVRALPPFAHAGVNRIENTTWMLY